MDSPFTDLPNDQFRNALLALRVPEVGIVGMQ